MSQTEEDLIAACQSGDKRAFGQLYDAYVRKLYDFIYYKTSRKEVAEDLTSIVFMKALQNIGKYQHTDTGSFSGWLYSIARNTVIDHYRSVRPNDNIDDAFDLPHHARIEERTEAAIQVGKIQDYLKTLPSIQRDIILMRVWQELPYKTIAAAVGKTEDNCKVIYSRSIKELRSALATSLALTLILTSQLYGF
jgi:RNA polymerase sigma-70 factor (ECF subfamily)